jgi:benzodiazapine receptor
MALSFPAAVAIPVLGGFGVATRMDHQARATASMRHASAAKADAPRHCVQLKTWYPALRKPSWTPPNWAFPVAWTALYVAMGTASWLVWRDGGIAEHPLPLALYAAQLLLNWAWSPLFFTAHRLGAALLDAGLQLVSIIACIGTSNRCAMLRGISFTDACACVRAATFYPVSHTAAYLMVPLLAWVSYATALNAKILSLNTERKRE